MGLKMYSSFKSELLFNLGGHDNLTTYIDGAQGIINTAYLDFCSKNKFYHTRKPQDIRFPELDDIDEKTTSDGSAYVMLPIDSSGKLDWLLIHDVWDSTNDNQLEYISHTEYIGKTGRADTASEGEPESWTIYGNKLYVYPTADAIYTLKIYNRRRPTLMSAATSTTEIGNEWDEPILALATILGLKKLKMYEEMELWKKDWIEMMRDRLGFYDKHKSKMNKYFHLDTQYKRGFKYQ